MSDETPAAVQKDDDAATRAGLIAQAITALTAAARTTRIIGRGTENEHREQVDFGEIACQVITAVAANVGDVEDLLAGRPGSWEADYVRQIVQSTAGEDDAELLRYRTEPVRMTIDVEGTFDDFGLYELYDEAVAQLIRQADEADAALFEAVATATERGRIEQIQNAMVTMRVDSDRAKALMDEAQNIVEAVVRRAEDAGDPRAATLADASADALAVDLLWEQDQAAYIAAYRKTVERTLAERGASVDVELLIDAPGASRGTYAPLWEALEDALYLLARDTTPLPMTGQAPDWTDGTPADALRRAGLTYIARVQGKV